MLNRNLGKYLLLHAWDNILQDMPTLQLKPSSLPHSFPTPTPTRTPHLLVPIHPNHPPTNPRQGTQVHLLVSIT